MKKPISLDYIVNILIFSVGFLTCFLLLYFLSLSNLERPLSVSLDTGGNNAPGDWIGLDQIRLTDTAIILEIPNATISSYASTGSMKPTLDYGSNGIRIVPSSPEQIDVGDIITFGRENIVHRVVEKGLDEEGYWFITKGDNNNLLDDKIRFQDIKYVTIGVLY